MKEEIKYTKAVGEKHIKAFGQYFTNHAVADFMCAWTCKNAKSMLDPAVGNSIFFSCAKKYSSQCRMTGYELDDTVLRYFGNPVSARMIQDNYLLCGWDEKYDAIVCNPPYSRFQTVENRRTILDTIFKHTGVKCSGYTNLCILFLVKSIFQLADHGRLAYIIPSEFMNSKYGTAVKQLLLDRKLLRAVINFQNDGEIFFNATTTCCILLLDHEPKTQVCFYNLLSIDELKPDLLDDTNIPCVCEDYDTLSASDKWRFYIKQEACKEYRNLKPISQFCSVSRGIATGANDFFCFSSDKAAQYGIPQQYLTRCICRSADVKVPIFDVSDFDSLSESGKTVYLLDISKADHPSVLNYIDRGMMLGVHQKYLTSKRNPWYAMEQKPAAPIWVSSACRGAVKFVRNLAMVKSLTTFHSMFVHEQYLEDIDLVFSYFLTPTAQAIIRENRKELGNGLEKFQPNDLNSGKMIDLDIISPRDRMDILDLYKRILVDDTNTCVEKLDAIFSEYLQ